MPLTVRHWLLHWVPSYNGIAPADRRLAPSAITEITSECLGAFLRDEAAAYLDQARIAVDVPHVRRGLVAQYVWKIQRGRD